ncbi:alpha/beta fold hydrolase [Nocardioides dilutus]
MDGTARAADLAAVREERLLGPGGVDLAVQELGEGRLVVIANGLGGSMRAWTPFLARFAPGHRVVAYDYRGLYRSGPPPAPEAVTIHDHAADLLAVLRWAGGEPALVMGWSMGVQVAVEAALAEPDLVAGLVLVAGAPGDPLAGVLHTSLSRIVIPPVSRVVEAGARPFGAALRLLAASGSGPQVLRRCGLVAPTCDLETFHALSGDFAGLDWRLYMRTLRAMAGHDAWPRLGELTAPTLVVGGTRDLFLPTDTVRATSAAIPDAELLLIEGATHYLPLEFPEVLDERVRRFEAERLGGPGAST